MSTVCISSKGTSENYSFGSSEGGKRKNQASPLKKLKQ